MLRGGQNPDSRSFSSHCHEDWRFTEVAPCQSTPFFLSDVFPGSGMVYFMRATRTPLVWSTGEHQSYT